MIDFKNYKNVLIIGSCVAHDFAKTLFKDNSNVNFHYVWRVSTISLVSKKPYFDLNLSGFDLSQEEIKTLQSDWSKSFQDKFNSDIIYDLIIIDYIRDCYDVINLKNSFVTYGVEIDKYSITDTIHDDFNVINYNSCDYINLWSEAAKKFKALVFSLNCQVLNIFPRFAFHSFAENKFDLVDQNTLYELHKRAFHLYKLHKLIENLMPLSIFSKMPDFPLLFSRNHRWGLNPLHFNTLVYDYWVKDFLSGTENLPYNEDQYNLILNEIRINNFEDELYLFLKS